MCLHLFKQKKANQTVLYGGFEHKDQQMVGAINRMKGIDKPV